MRTCDLETSGRVWSYVPASHKTEHHGIERIVFLGPQAQAVLTPFLEGRAPGADDRLRLELAFQLACGRSPRPEERAASERFLGAQRRLYAQGPEAEAQAWTDFCQMVLASNAFLYVE